MEHCYWSLQVYRGVPVQLHRLSTTRASVLKLRSRVELAFAHILKNIFARRASSSRPRIRVFIRIRTGTRSQTLHVTHTHARSHTSHLVVIPHTSTRGAT